MTSFKEMAWAAVQDALDEGPFKLLFESALRRGEDDLVSTLALKNSIGMPASTLGWLFAIPALPDALLKFPHRVSEFDLGSIPAQSLVPFALNLASGLELRGSAMRKGAEIDDGGNWYHARILPQLAQILETFADYQAFPDFKEQLLARIASPGALFLSLELPPEKTERFLRLLIAQISDSDAWVSQILADLDYSEMEDIKLASMLLMQPMVTFEAVGTLPWSSGRSFRPPAFQRWSSLALEYGANHLKSPAARENFASFCNDWTGTVKELIDMSNDI